MDRILSWTELRYFTVQYSIARVINNAWVAWRCTYRNYGSVAWKHGPARFFFGLVYVELYNLGKHAPLNPAGYHMYELYKQRSITNVVAAFFLVIHVG